MIPMIPMIPMIKMVVVAESPHTSSLESLDGDVPNQKRKCGGKEKKRGSKKCGGKEKKYGEDG